MEEGKVILTGAPTGYDDKSPPRLPIFDVVKNPKYFSLLVQGLSSCFLYVQRTFYFVHVTEHIIPFHSALLSLHHL